MSKDRSSVRWGITAKFLIFNCLVILALGAILVIVLISFQQVNTLTTTMLDQNLNRIIENGRSSQELTTLFAELVTVIFSDQSEAGAARLQALQEQLRSLTNQDEHAELQALIQQFTQQLSAVLAQAASVKRYAGEFATIEDNFVFNVEMLEDILAEKIEATGAENLLLLNQLKQLQAMSTGYRSAFLQIVKEVNSLQNSGMQDIDEAEKEPPVFQTISALLARFQTVTANKDTEISGQGQQLVAVMTSYKEAIRQFQAAQRTFLEQLTLAGQTKEQALAALRSRDEESMRAAESIRTDIQAQVQRSRQFVMALSAGIGGFLLIFSISAIATVRPLVTLAQAAQKIAEGNMNLVLPKKTSRDEIGILTNAFATMVHHLNGTVRDVKTAAEQVALKSEEMTVVAEQMSQGSSQQAAASQEVSASMEEMAANIRQNAENAKTAEKMATQSASDAQRGSEAVSEIIAAMQDIANEISSIQEIASQTNILSLNATIEAARAQDFGKGFAVVASSVRELAHLSREAANKIQKLVANCVGLSEQAGECLDRLTPNSEKTSDLVKEIASASHEQALGAEQINHAIQQLDSVTQQNASTAEQVAATVEMLTAQAVQLQEAMAFFTLKVEEVVEEQEENGDLLQRIQELEQQLGELRGFAQAMPHSVRAKKNTLMKKPPSGSKVDLENENPPMGDERDQEFERY